MNILGALNQLSFRVRTGSWSQKKDRVAINSIIDFVEEVQNATINKNPDLIKLFVVALNYHCALNRVNLSNHNLIKDFLKTLDKPLEYHIDDFCRRQNDLSQSNFLAEFDVCYSSPRLVLKNEKEDGLKRLEEAIKNEPNFKRCFHSTWTIEKITTVVKNYFLLKYH